MLGKTLHNFTVNVVKNELRELRELDTTYPLSAFEIVYLFCKSRVEKLSTNGKKSVTFLDIGFDEDAAEVLSLSMNITENGSNDSRKLLEWLLNQIHSVIWEIGGGHLGFNT